MNNNDEWSELIQEIKDNVRSHAGYFAWEGSSSIEEAGAVQCFSESLDYKSQSFFHSIKSRETDPPDCEAVNAQGEKIAIEVTELVDGKSIANARQNKAIPWAPWSIEKLDKTISERIKRKDNPKEIKGGPYAEYILLIYSDEPAVLDFDLIEHIKNTKYGPTNLVTRAFFLTSYSPWEKCCPYLELKL